MMDLDKVNRILKFSYPIPYWRAFLPLPPSRLSLYLLPPFLGSTMFSETSLPYQNSSILSHFTGTPPSYGQ